MSSNQLSSKQQAPDQATRRNDERVQLEMQLVGGLLAFAKSKPYLAQDVLSVCPSPCFLSPQARVAMEAIRAVCESGEALDLISVASEMRRLNAHRLNVALPNIAETALNMASLMTEASVLEAAKTIAGEKIKDEASIEVARVVRDLQAFSLPLDFATEGLKKSLEILESGVNSEGESFTEQLAEYAAWLDSPERSAKPVSTPWKNLNSILRGGILPGELAVLAARPSVGKSALSLNMAWSVACSGKKALFFSLEMPKQQLFDRLVANVGNIDLSGFRAGLSGPDRDKAKRAVLGMRGKSLEVVDNASITVGEVRRRTRIAQRRAEVGLVVVDYLQLCTPDDHRVPREQQVSAMSRGFKLLAKELNVPVLLLAQLSRKGEDANRSPILSDLRESGAIEQDADIVIFLHQARHRTYSVDEPVQVIVAKGRSSGTGRSNLIFRRLYQRFEDSTQAEFALAEREDSMPNYVELGQAALE